MVENKSVPFLSHEPHPFALNILQGLRGQFAGKSPALSLHRDRRATFEIAEASLKNRSPSRLRNAEDAICENAFSNSKEKDSHSGLAAADARAEALRRGNKKPIKFYKNPLRMLRGLVTGD